MCWTDTPLIKIQRRATNKVAPYLLVVFKDTKKIRQAVCYSYQDALKLAYESAIEYDNLHRIVGSPRNSRLF